jgi:hypothetical protein
MNAGRLKCWIGGVAVIGPGLPGWAESEAILAGAIPWERSDIVVPAPSLLSPTERRRTSLTVRLALSAAMEACADVEAPETLETVFASGNGDGAVVGGILEALHDPAGVIISPTQFHNSVHNAAAGYWHIAVRSTAPSISLGCHDYSFGTGLLAAVTQTMAHKAGVLLCAYDVPLPEPLATVRPTAFSFATAMVLWPEKPRNARGMLSMSYVPTTEPKDQSMDGLGALVTENPAARSLPLLRALAMKNDSPFSIALAEDAHLSIQVASC